MPTSSSCRFTLIVFLLTAGIGVAQEVKAILPPDDPRIGYSDYIHLEQITDPTSPTGKTVRFDRLLDMPGKGYRWDNPGARVRFRTDSATVEVLLRYSDRHISTTVRNPIGRYWIDGESKPEWTFRTQSTAVTRQPEMVHIPLSAPSPDTFHNYEIVMPYGDSVEFLGLQYSPESHFETPPTRPSLRYVAYGDSITQGFNASEQALTYSFLLAEKKKWQLLNMGLAGRSSTPSDGAVLASLSPDVITVLMGVNDWQGGVSVDAYRNRMEGFLIGLRAACPQVPVYLITPLWVSPSWKPEKAIADIESYRQVLRDISAARSDPNLHLIEGPTLLDPDPALFSSVAVHPNDRGFAQMAERLAVAMSSQPSL